METALAATTKTLAHHTLSHSLSTFGTVVIIPIALSLAVGWRKFIR